MRTSTLPTEFETAPLRFYAWHAFPRESVASTRRSRSSVARALGVGSTTVHRAVSGLGAGVPMTLGNEPAVGSPKLPEMLAISEGVGFGG
jgi:hypothetical protein